MLSKLEENFFLELYSYIPLFDLPISCFPLNCINMTSNMLSFSFNYTFNFQCWCYMYFFLLSNSTSSLLYLLSDSYFSSYSSFALILQLCSYYQICTFFLFSNSFYCQSVSMVLLSFTIAFYLSLIIAYNLSTTSSYESDVQYNCFYVSFNFKHKPSTYSECFYIKLPIYYLYFLSISLRFPDSFWFLLFSSSFLSVYMLTISHSLLFYPLYYVLYLCIQSLQHSILCSYSLRIFSIILSLSDTIFCMNSLPFPLSLRAALTTDSSYSYSALWLFRCYILFTNSIILLSFTSSLTMCSLMFFSCYALSYAYCFSMMEDDDICLFYISFLRYLFAYCSVVIFYMFNCISC